MKDVALPAGDGTPEVVRSFAACLAAVTETAVAEVPSPPGDLTGAVAQWRGWLAGRDTGLAPVADAARFHWPGYWIAVLAHQQPGPDAREVAVLMFGTPSGVVLSPQDPALLGRAASDLDVREGYVVAGLDPSRLPRAGVTDRLVGRVEVVAVAEHASGPMRVVEQGRALAGRGLDGDRYAAKAGTFTPGRGGRGYDLTLIEAEVLDALGGHDGVALGYAEARRNLVTRGIDLNALVGRRFRVGDAECLGRRLCEPCSHLERLTSPGVLRGLIHRGGLRADVVADGRIDAGAVIEPVEDA